jgi:signal peptidase I
LAVKDLQARADRAEVAGMTTGLHGATVAVDGGAPARRAGHELGADASQSRVRPRQSQGPAGPRPPRPRGRARTDRAARTRAIEWGAIVIVALLVAILVRATVVQAFWIPSRSMDPTLRVKDRLLVEKVSYSVRDVKRGEIIVFRRPEALHQDFKDLIKRVIGLPGDLVEGRDGMVFVNGRALSEPYLPEGETTTDFAPVRVPLDSYFVMGDNRDESNDSRYWGTVDRRLIVGRAVFRVFPLRRIGVI